MATAPQVPVQVKTWLEHADITPAAATQLISFLANCQGFLVSNADAGINVRVGSANVAANKGAIIFPKSTLWISNDGQGVFVCPESGTPKVTYTEGA